MANVLLPVLKCEQARLVLAAVREVRLTVVTHFQGKTHLSPVSATASVPVLGFPGDVLLDYCASRAGRWV